MSKPVAPHLVAPTVTPFDRTPDGWPAPPPGCLWAERADERCRRQPGMVWLDAGLMTFAPVCLVSGVGMSDRDGARTPPGCRVPSGWQCWVWPLGRDARSLGDWLDYADTTVAEALGTEHLPRGADNPTAGWRAVVRATRLLARSEGVLPAGRDAADLPRTRADARAELLLLRDWLLAARGRPGRDAGPADSPAKVAGPDGLTDRQLAILDEMLAVGALTREARTTTPEIAA